jgi:hypothetical protein
MADQAYHPDLVAGVANILLASTIFSLIVIVFGGGL